MKLKPIFIFLSGIILSQAACASPPVKLEEKEKLLGTDGETLSVFHRVAEKKRDAGLRFPGFLIAFEKAPREKIGLEKNCLACFSDLKEVDKSFFNHEEEEYYQKVKKILNDPKRVFISHIVEYQLRTEKSNIPYIDETFHYDVYGFNPPSNVFKQGEEALNQLGERLETLIQDANKLEEPYTHLMFYSMGWNTDQQEALLNYDSLIGQMLSQKGQRKFKPLFIGISWPSQWNQKITFLSYANKGNDADEVAMIWINRLLRKILIPIKKEYSLPLVLVGHSFGTRLITRSVFGYPSELTQDHHQQDIDLVIGLQGAFSINRFLPGKGEEGTPYKNFSQYAKKFVFTWSEYDTAVPVAKYISGTKHIGGRPGYEESLKSNIFTQFSLVVGTTNDNRAIPFSRIESSDNTKSVQKWKDNLNDPNTIAIVNASQLIRFSSYGTSGDAHSDIYTPGVAGFIWDCLDNLPR